MVSLVGTVYQHSIRVGGDQFDDAIINHVPGLYNVMLGEQTAEHVKKHIGSASGSVPRESMRAVGRGVEDGLPRTIELSNHDVAEALTVPLNQVVSAVKAVLEKAPPELITDVAHRGIVLTGAARCLLTSTAACSTKPGWPCAWPSSRTVARCAAPGWRWGASSWISITDPARVSRRMTGAARNCEPGPFWPMLWRIGVQAVASTSFPVDRSSQESQCPERKLIPLPRRPTRPSSQHPLFLPPRPPIRSARRRSSRPNPFRRSPCAAASTC
ncbi:MAG: Rod shape-determining protein MreB [Burkholderia gladioli]|nr:MAG: Rod shape-determining protein MreB [Burkholderia gladioli]